MKKTPEEIRQGNLKLQLESQFEGDYEALANAIHRSKSTVIKYLSKGMVRKISANTARTIERNLQLESGYLDEEYHGSSLVYYVTLKVSRNFTFDVVKRVYEYPEAVECSALLGEYDVLIKVEVPTYHDLQVFYDKLSRMPGVQRTRTYPAVDSIRWQRPQSSYSVLKNPNKFTNYAEEYKHRRILEYMDEIRKLERGQISSDGLLQNQVDLCELMNQVKRQYLAIRLHDETYPNETAYLSAERARLADKEAKVQVKRIVILPKAMVNDPMQTVEFVALLDKAREQIRAGAQLRFLFTEDWVASTRHHTPECFAVVDDEYVYLKSGEEHSRLMTKDDDVMHYQRAFAVNWDRALTLEALTGN